MLFRHLRFALLSLSSAGLLASQQVFIQPDLAQAQNAYKADNFFTGTWEGYFSCGPNLYILEYYVSKNNLIQTVISHGGENCLPNGHVSVIAQIPDYVSEGKTYTSIIHIATGAQTMSATIQIIDANTLNYNGAILRRR